jgi:hypothetical protein
MFLSLQKKRDQSVIINELPEAQGRRRDEFSDFLDWFAAGIEGIAAQPIGDEKPLLKRINRSVIHSAGHFD